MPEYHSRSMSTPAGWYSDPSLPGQQRYWDGEQWTQQFAPQAHPAQAGVPQANLAERDARNWAVIAHVSAYVGLLTGVLGFMGPLVVYLIKKDDHPFIRDQAAEALNFNLSVLLYAVVLGIATFILFFLIVGIFLIPVLIGLGIAWVVLIIVAATKASKGEAYRYPLTIRFLT